VNVDTKALIDEAERQIPKSDAFIAARYRFQILRLFFYSDQHALATDYYEKVARTFSVENSVKYRAMELAAGAYPGRRCSGKRTIFTRWSLTALLAERVVLQIFPPDGRCRLKETCAGKNTARGWCRGNCWALCRQRCCNRQHLRHESVKSPPLLI
jgi:hypothetical protein